MKLTIGADHGGFALKERVMAYLTAKEIDFADFGCFSTESCDYPDFAEKVAESVSEGVARQGILICTTGVGMSMTANKFPRVRAALCTQPKMAEMTRKHNNANILCLGASLNSEEEVVAILDAWFASEFEGGRHERRVSKITSCEESAELVDLNAKDPEIYKTIIEEDERQQHNIELIASENIVSKAVREAQGSRMTNKYAEGYPAKRWYNGCEVVDETEQLAIDRAKELFGAEHANVQPHSGSSANMGVYMSVLEPGDTNLAMS